MAGTVLPSSSTPTLSLRSIPRSSFSKPKLETCFLIFFSAETSAKFRCSAKKKVGFMDQILDYIEGGPKLRKWYGAPDVISNDGSNMEEDDGNLEEEVIRDAVLVTDGDSEIGQMIILSLIVKKAQIKALVKDKRAALEAFGTYVEPIAGDTSDRLFIRKVLKGVRTIICPNIEVNSVAGRIIETIHDQHSYFPFNDTIAIYQEGFLSNIENLRGVQHIILLSQLSMYTRVSGIEALMKGNARKLTEQDESFLKSSGIPYTIIRAGLLQDTPGRNQGFSFEEGISKKGSLSKEDAAFVCAEAIDAVPQREFIFEVANGKEMVSDWKGCLGNLMKKAEQLQ